MRSYKLGMRTALKMQDEKALKTPAEERLIKAALRYEKHWSGNGAEWSTALDLAIQRAARAVARERRRRG